MATTLYRPQCLVAVATRNGTGPLAWLDQIYEARTAITIAPQVGRATFTVPDPGGDIARGISPMDQVWFYFSSPGSQIVRQQTGATPPTDPAWTGFVDRAYSVWDYRADQGRACMVTCSSFWKVYVTTKIPFARFGVSLPQGNLPVTDLLAMAQTDAMANHGLTFLGLDTSKVSDLTLKTSPYWQVPTEKDYINPDLQSWASYMISNAQLAGNEIYVAEDGTLVLQETQFARSAVDLDLPDSQLFALSGGVSDEQLVTNVVLNYGVYPNVAGAAYAPGPAPSDSDGPHPGGIKDKGVLPDRLKGLPHLGARGQLLYEPWIADQQFALRYANLVRTLGIAGVFGADIECALTGAARLAQICQLNMSDPRNPEHYRFYVTTVQHQYSYPRDASTLLTGRYGIKSTDHWDIDQLLHSQGPATPPLVVYSSGIQLPPVDQTDPAVALTSPTLSREDILAILQGQGAPQGLQLLADHILLQCQSTGIDPSFALAVWQRESGLGTQGAGATSDNPGNITDSTGADVIYGTWQNGVDAWFTLAQQDVGKGGTTVTTFGALYNPGHADWAPTVIQLMLYYRRHAGLTTGYAQAATDNVMDPGTGNGDQPMGNPFTGDGPAPYPVELGYNAVRQFEYNVPGRGHVHTGIDFGCPVGTPVIATMDGTVLCEDDGVTDSYGETGWGNHIRLINGTYQVIYGHLSQFAAGAQQASANGTPAFVAHGTVIGYSGATGNATGPHLHYELRRYPGTEGTDVDPTPSLSLRRGPLPFVPTV